MFKGNNKYYFVLLVLFALLVWVEYNQPKPIDWRRTYTKQDKIPFGCNAFYRLLSEDLFKNKVEQQNQTPFNVLADMPDKKTTYVFVNTELSFSALDCKYLLDFVKEGNTVLMAANSFSGLIADTFKIETKYDYNLFNDTAKKLELNFYNSTLKTKKNYTYPKSIEVFYFKSFDTSKVTILAAADSNAVFIKTSWGQGNFYFLSLPDIYTNYFVVNDPNREVAYKTLSYIDANKIWWDEYYKSFNIKQGSELQFIFGNDSLYAAYTLAGVTLLVFMLFGLKRKQKAIPIVEPLQNTTLQFVEVVGSVYYDAKNHKIIAEEKINSLYEYLRSKFSVAGRTIDEEGLLRISKLSTIPLVEIKKLVAVINNILKQTSISEKELIELNFLIETFHKQNKR
ncbi:MAG TPA: DUF4350 domain-containing protein [Bacteroidia bacterium]